MSTKNKCPMPGKHRRGSIKFTQPSLAKQSFKDEVNINNIMRKYEKTQIIDHINSRQGQYGDFFDIPSFLEAQNQMIMADEMFNELPARVRKEFDNDPIKFVEFVQNPDNVEKLVTLGLTDVRPEKPPKPVIEKVTEKSKTKEANENE